MKNESSLETLWMRLSDIYHMEIHSSIRIFKLVQLVFLADTNWFDLTVISQKDYCVFAQGDTSYVTGN